MKPKQMERVDHPLVTDESQTTVKDDEETLDHHEAVSLIAGMVEAALQKHRENGFCVLGVPTAIVDRVLARCREEQSEQYVGEFMLLWMTGDRSMPECAEPSVKPRIGHCVEQAPPPVQRTRRVLDI
jgi:hypothetical protein